MRLARNERKAARAALMGSLQATPGRAARMRSATLSGPITVAPEVQP